MDVSNVTVAINAFFRASSFNQPIGGWNVTSISNMNNMFRDASVFDSDISCWCVEHDPREQVLAFLHQLIHSLNTFLDGHFRVLQLLR